MLDIAEWRRMKSVGELRFEQSLPVKQKKDSSYGKQMVRQRRKFAKLQLPKAVEANLPFKSVPKEDKKLRKKAGDYASETSKNISKAVTAVIKTERERAIDSALNRLHTVKIDKVRKNLANKKVKMAEKIRKEQKIQELRDAHTRENRKMKHVKQGKAEESKRKRMRLGEA